MWAFNLVATEKKKSHFPYSEFLKSGILFFYVEKNIFTGVVVDIQ